MREHIRAAIKTAKSYGGDAEFIPSNGHGRLRLTDAQGRVESIVVSWSPRNRGVAAKILADQVAKFMRGQNVRSRREKEC